jgi:hypothetical protein
MNKRIDAEPVYNLPPPLLGQNALKACWKPLLLNWLIPGAGYWFINEKKRAISLFGVTFIFSTLAFLELMYGINTGSKGGVYVPILSPIQWLQTLGAVATAGVGPIYSLFAFYFAGVDAEPIRNLTQEYGATYIIVAGLLNWLCLIDIFDRATGRWVWRLPVNEQKELAIRDNK